ncbi:tRNA modification GTPase [Schlesneria paludicola]|uniref:tRNA modification GTPase n=1 Tax=Schlesneria paludicola TaxID=360056 RepID=UPI00029A77D6|nr:GTPase [Schlesneria paludicola]
MDLNVDEPIAALASPPGGSSRGIIRISGHNVRSILSEWFEPDDVHAWNGAKSAQSHTGRLVLNGLEEPLRCPVHALYWPTRRSYTGQPLIELHLPGSPSLLEETLQTAFRHGSRPARPGEFTLRAFLAGKLDLLQAEAVLGVIDARNQVELQTALGQLAGGISGRLATLRRDLLELLADLEAGLDFIEEDIEFVSRAEVVARLSDARGFVESLVAQTRDRMVSRVRPRVVLAGLPNAGKSTLFNRLIGRNLAIVSPEQGTTRDFLVRAVEWNDLSFDLVDTAGWEESADGIGAAAQTHRATQLKQSDLLIWCTAATLSDDERQQDDALFEASRDQARVTLRLMTKIDLAPAKAILLKEKNGVSAVSDLGLIPLKADIQRHLSSDHAGRSEWLGVTAARCRETLDAITVALGRAQSVAQVKASGDELIAVDLRDALEHLGVILGTIYTDDILDRIFSKFCIGK